MENEDKKNSNSLKITLIGDSGVGKTCIIRRFTTNEFDSNSFATDGVSYSKKEITKTHIQKNQNHQKVNPRKFVMN